jgi:hypothetical protein
MFCTSCGHAVGPSSTFCQSCGKQLDNQSGKPPATQGGRHNSQGTKIFWVVMAGIVLAAIAGSIGRAPSDNGASIASTKATTSEPVPSQSNQDDMPSESPTRKLDTKTTATVEKLLREKWAIETQNNLWREGMEMTFQVHGTTLYIKYVPAGESFAFQFREQFLQQNADELKKLGFKRIELSNGDNVWVWTVSQL